MDFTKETENRGRIPYPIKLPLYGIWAINLSGVMWPFRLELSLGLGSF